MGDELIRAAAHECAEAKSNDRWARAFFESGNDEMGKLSVRHAHYHRLAALALRQVAAEIECERDGFSPDAEKRLHAAQDAMRKAMAPTGAEVKS